MWEVRERVGGTVVVVAEKEGTGDAMLFGRDKITDNNRKQGLKKILCKKKKRR